MQLAMVGLGRMGANMAQRLKAGGHEPIGCDPGASARERVAALGIAVVATPREAAAACASPRTMWLMVPAGQAVDDCIAAMSGVLAPGDIVVDGGNSHYRDSQRRAAQLGGAGVLFVDCGTSGGIWGLQAGYSMMLGGEAAAIERLRPLLETLAPARDAGWARVGPSGAGHFAKMIHNGIEYGMMQAYAEGFSLLHHKREFDFDLHAVAQVWQHGSVVRSWLLDLIAAALGDDAGLAGVAPRVADSGEGRWTVAEAIDLDVPAPIITQSLIERLRSRDPDSFADRLLATMRNRFGGHPVSRE